MSHQLSSTNGHTQQPSGGDNVISPYFLVTGGASFFHDDPACSDDTTLMETQRHLRWCSYRFKMAGEVFTVYSTEQLLYDLQQLKKQQSSDPIHDTTDSAYREFHARGGRYVHAMCLCICSVGSVVSLPFHCTVKALNAAEARSEIRRNHVDLRAPESFEWVEVPYATFIEEISNGVGPAAQAASIAERIRQYLADLPESSDDDDDTDEHNHHGHKLSVMASDRAAMADEAGLQEALEKHVQRLKASISASSTGGSVTNQDKSESRYSFSPQPRERRVEYRPYSEDYPGEEGF